MSTVQIVNTKNENVGQLELNDDIFNLEVKEYILHDVVRMQRASWRAGTACTKTRVEVSGLGVRKVPAAPDREAGHRQYGVVVEQPSDQNLEITVLN
jgi:ribosomal protein L4